MFLLSVAIVGTTAAGVGVGITYLVWHHSFFISDHGGYTNNDDTITYCVESTSRGYGSELRSHRMKGFMNYWRAEDVCTKG